MYGLLVVGSVLTACSEVLDKINEQFEAEEEIFAYLDGTNPSSKLV
ncbi:hypothetical protein ACQCT5_21160 [Sutcliffiella halmapala]